MEFTTFGALIGLIIAIILIIKKVHPAYSLILGALIGGIVGGGGLTGTVNTDCYYPVVFSVIEKIRYHGDHC